MLSVHETDEVGSVLETVKTIEYQYVEPVREVVTQLRLFPCAERGAQRLLRRECAVWPDPDRTRQFMDEFGNEVVEFRHEQVAARLRFSIGLVIEHTGTADPGRMAGLRLVASHGMPAAGVSAFLRPSRLVDESEEILRAAKRVRKIAATAEEQVAAIGEWVHQVMEFHPGVTDVETPASAALAGKRGVCQDYAHVMLAICRANGIPARYISGFIPGEGYMHAWVEALVVDGATGAAHWMACDPTHNRRADTQYLAVALGRDYTDVSPVTGTFFGSAPGRLTSWSETVLRGPLA